MTAPLARESSASTGAAVAPPARPEPFALELRDVHKRFGRSAIIRGAALQLRAGERLALIGPNGAGKTTLLDLISGATAPDSGTILLAGQPIGGLSPFEIHRRGLARSFQVSRLFARLSVIENLRCALLWGLGQRYSFWRGLGRLHALNARADAVLTAIALQSRRELPAGELAYAEQRALEIGITIASGAAFVVLDEPCAGMSQSETARCVELIRRVTAGRSLLIVEHDMGVVFELADRIAVLVDGQVIACDTPQAIRADARVRQAYLGAALAAASD